MCWLCVSEHLRSSSSKALRPQCQSLGQVAPWCFYSPATRLFPLGLLSLVACWVDTVQLLTGGAPAVQLGSVSSLSFLLSLVVLEVVIVQLLEDVSSSRLQ